MTCYVIILIEVQNISSWLPLSNKQHVQYQHESLKWYNIWLLRNYTHRCGYFFSGNPVQEKNSASIIQDNFIGMNEVTPMPTKGMDNYFSWIC